MTTNGYPETKAGLAVQELYDWLDPRVLDIDPSLEVQERGFDLLDGIAEKPVIGVSIVGEDEYTILFPNGDLCRYSSDDIEDAREAIEDDLHEKFPDFYPHPH